MRLIDALRKRKLAVFGVLERGDELSRLEINIELPSAPLPRSAPQG